MVQNTTVSQCLNSGKYLASEPFPLRDISKRAVFVHFHPIWFELVFSN